ncbi:MAG: hypothetical protein NTZ67_00880 [Gammaproteobacteria bacterium]|nr:hypothetical protein [Gammaproteobacteria bacterium]
MNEVEFKYSIKSFLIIRDMNGDEADKLIDLFMEPDELDERPIFQAIEPFVSICLRTGENDSLLNEAEFSPGLYPRLVRAVATFLFQKEKEKDSGKLALLAEAMIETILYDEFINAAKKTFYDALKINPIIKNARDVASKQFRNLCGSFSAVRFRSKLTSEDFSPDDMNRYVVDFETNEKTCSDNKTYCDMLVSDFEVTEEQQTLSDAAEAEAEAEAKDLLQSLEAWREYFEKKPPKKKL